MELLQQPPASVEYLAVDTETNGRAGDGCELTEVGAVLVGGGELHESWESLVRRAAAAVARHRALHRDHPGHGRLRPCARPGACPAGRADAGASARGP
ncbi:MAG: hypothetical protein WKF40_01430 [Thermoleophilaceae bacterium]